MKECIRHRRCVAISINCAGIHNAYANVLTYTSVRLPSKSPHTQYPCEQRPFLSLRQVNARRSLVCLAIFADRGSPPLRRTNISVYLVCVFELPCSCLCVCMCHRLLFSNERIVNTPMRRALAFKVPVLGL